MKASIEKLLKSKHKTIPILSFPSTALLDISVRELLASPAMQAKGMQAIAARCPVGASLNMMDLSVEAEAFGAEIRITDDEVPTVEHGIIEDIADAAAITVPAVGTGRTGLCLEGVRLAKETITDLPVFCGVIGPYSLAGRLYDMTELMMACYDSPDEVCCLLDKATDFIIAYLKAFKAAGADGVILAEPAAGLLSPALAEKFSIPYVKRIFDAVNDESFIICYHNCGNAVGDMLDGIATLPADILHFGNAIDLKKAIEGLPKHFVVMGNVDPVLFRTGTPDEIRAAVESVYTACAGYENFMLSTGCDVPAAARWENIDAYFEKVSELYASGNR